MFFFFLFTLFVRNRTREFIEFQNLLLFMLHTVTYIHLIVLTFLIDHGNRRVYVFIKIHISHVHYSDGKYKIIHVPNRKPRRLDNIKYNLYGTCNLQESGMLIFNEQRNILLQRIFSLFVFISHKCIESDFLILSPLKSAYLFIYLH